MKLRDLVGCEFSKDYICLYMYPIGFEVFIDNGISISVTLFKFEINLTLGLNYTLFNSNSLIEKALQAKEKISKTTELN